MAAWLLQTTLKKWDLDGFLIAGLEDIEWPVKRYLPEPAEGDHVVLWMSGPEGDIIGLGHVRGPVRIRTATGDHDWPGIGSDEYWLDPALLLGSHWLPVHIDTLLSARITKRLPGADSVFSQTTTFHAPKSADPLRLTDGQWEELQALIPPREEEYLEWDYVEQRREVWNIARQQRRELIEVTSPLHPGEGINGVRVSLYSPDASINAIQGGLWLVSRLNRAIPHTYRGQQAFSNLEADRSRIESFSIGFITETLQAVPADLISTAIAGALAGIWTRRPGRAGRQRNKTDRRAINGVVSNQNSSFPVIIGSPPQAPVVKTVYSVTTWTTFPDGTKQVKQEQWSFNLEVLPTDEEESPPL